MARKPKATKQKIMPATNGNSYSAKDIYVLEGLEPVRKRPGMYIGTTGADGLHHLVWEVADNSIDEAMAGYAKKIEITLLPNNCVSVKDDGRGIPVERHKQTGKSALETVMTTLHAGGKFGGESYKVSGGLHGVGVSVVNALSSWLRAEVCREGVLWAQEYKRGKAQGAVKKIGKCGTTGTMVSFEPDPEIFQPAGGGKMPEFNLQTILDHMRRQAYLTKGLEIAIRDERQDTKAKDGSSLALSHSFYFEGGIVSYVRFLNAGETPKHETIFYVNREAEVNGGKKIQVEVAFQYTGDMAANELSFANNIYTGEGGMHLTGFRTALTRSLNSYAKKNEYFKKDDENLTGEDVREGLTAVISIKLPEPQFEGQTKAKLGTPEARTAVELVVGEALDEFLEKNPDEARQIIGQALLASKARLAAKAARETVLRKGALEGLMLPGKLADCQSKNPEESELYIVEGDSAGGCFSGDTKVALADGRNISLEQLVGESKKGMRHHCYTIANDGSVAIEKILNPRMTRKNARVIKITLDNNEEITCTPDHKFMLADGAYKEAARLQSNDSLMPLYRQHPKIGKRITIEGYELVFDPREHRWIFTHLLADRYNIARSTYLEIDGSHRHHRDFNKLNNNPDNITRLTREEHLVFHRQQLSKTIHRPDVVEKLRKLHRTPEFREKIRQKMLSPKMRKLLRERAQKQWSNPGYKQYMADKFLNFYYGNEEYRKRNSELLDRLQKEYWGEDRNRKTQAKRVRAYFLAHPEKRAELARLASLQWQDLNLKQWRSRKTKEQWTDAFREKRKVAYNKTYYHAALRALRDMYEKDGAISLDKYEELRKLTNDKNLLKHDTILVRFFGADPKKLETAVSHYNHKIKKIEKIAEVSDVYDIEVPGTHNFALASGVFVHNSAKQGRDRKFQAILPLRGKILNVEKSRLDKMLLSKEIRALIIAIGAAIGDDFDETKIRYHRIVIMTDADVDGAHIRTLLLTLFYRYFPRVVELGYLYIAEPPLYQIKSGKTLRYAYSDEEKEKIIREIGAAGKVKEASKIEKAGKGVRLVVIDEDAPDAATEETTDGEATPEGGKAKGVSIQRYKGLGEMNPSQLWETTMDPAHRTMQRVMIANAEAANRIFDILMGDEVAPRKKFIQTHAKSVRNLDI